MRKKQKVLVLMGPTASGKSALAVELARKFNGEIISADSRQIYHGLDIGTGKIKKREMKGVRHHLLDVASPKRIFTAHDFLMYGQRAMRDIQRRGKLSIITGGTGFYADVLVGHIILPSVSPNKKLRLRLERKSPAELFAMLKKRDPRRAKTIDPQNPRRLIRALEIVAAQGKSPPLRAHIPYDVLWIGIDVPKRELEIKLRARLVLRMKEGMLAEARKLHRQGLSYKRMETLGLEYRSLARLLQRKISRAEFEQELFHDIRRYAKRQLTYWKRNKEIRWFELKKKETIKKQVEFWRAH